MDILFWILLAMPTVAALLWLLQNGSIVKWEWRVLILCTLLLWQCVLGWLRYESKEETLRARVLKLWSVAR